MYFQDNNKNKTGGELTEHKVLLQKRNKTPRSLIDHLERFYTD